MPLSPLLMNTTSIMPDAFIPLSDIDASIQQDIRYATCNNFIGSAINGYPSPVAIVSRALGLALKNAQAQLVEHGLSLLIYDAYRPVDAVKQFKAWVHQPMSDGDLAIKAMYYPSYERHQLFTEGFIAEQSSHSRGSAVDVTLVDVHHNNQPLDMGSIYDYFHPSSFTASTDISSEAQANRHQLKTVMERHGLINLDTEWWHFALAPELEPYPNTYFNFPVQSGL